MLALSFSEFDPLQKSAHRGGARWVLGGRFGFLREPDSLPIVLTGVEVIE